MSELSHVRVQLRFQIRTYNIYMWPYVKLCAHAQWYVMWEELSVDHIKHSNYFKRTLKMFLNGSVRFGYYLTFNLLSTALLTWRK